MIATDVTDLVIDAMLKMAFAGGRRRLDTARPSRFHDDFDDRRRVALLDRVVHLRGQGRLAVSAIRRGLVGACAADTAATAAATRTSATVLESFMPRGG
jgi:hypothetical protein